MKYSTFNIPFFFLFCSLFSIQLHAQAPGSLDADFGNNGMTSLTWEGLNRPNQISNNITLAQNSNVVWDSELQPDGKIILMTSDQLIRLNPNGEPDLSFGGGVVHAEHSFFSQMALQPDGKIVIVGVYLASGNVMRLYLRRLLPNGSPDLAFGTSSIVDSISSQAAQGYPLIQPDGKIVLLTSKGSSQYWLGRFNPDGSYDTSFGQSGVKTIQVSAGNRIDASYMRAHLNSDGTIFIANSTLPANDIYALYPKQYDLIKIKSNGNPDNSFGIGGVTHPEPLSGLLSGVLFAPDGKILFYGQYLDGTNLPNEHFIVRLLPDGSTDESFGELGLGLYLSRDGVVGYSNYYDISLVQQHDGKLVLARGYPGSSTVNQNLPALFRLNADGTVDPTFGVNGRATVDYSNVPIQQMISLPDGRIFVAGILDFRRSNIYHSFPINLFAARLFADETVGTQNPDHSLISFRIEPNPCRNSTMLQFPTNCTEAAMMKVYNSLGRLILTENIENPRTHRINTGGWTPGVYLVELRQGEIRSNARLLKIE